MDIAKEHVNGEAETAALQYYSHTEYRVRAPGEVVPVGLSVTNKCTFPF